MKKLKWLFAGLTFLASLLVAMIRTLTFFPKQRQPELVVNPPNAPLLQPGQSVKVMTFNVQYMAGKNYIFYYDGGSDSRPSSEDIGHTIEEVARIIQSENPDVVLLQEVDEDAKRTDYEDQLARLLELMPDRPFSYAATFYWRAKFVPFPYINGRVGMKLVTLSKYRMETAVRHQLTQYPWIYFWQHFMPKRAILEVHLPVAGGPDFVVLNTHLELFSFGTDVQQAQMTIVEGVIAHQADRPWILGGDFNLLPPETGAAQLSEFEQGIYQPTSALKSLYEKHHALPNLKDVLQTGYQKWYTHFPNGEDETGPNKTIDYLFFSKMMTLLAGTVRQHDTQHISDHLPLIAEVQLPI